MIIYKIFFIFVYQTAIVLLIKKNIKMKVNVTYKNIELDLDAMAVTHSALNNYELNISKIIEDLKVRLNAADSTSEIRDIQTDLKQAVNVVRDIKRSKEILSTAKSEIV